MTIFIGSDVAGQRLKDVVKTFLKENNHDVVDVTEGKELDFIDSTLAVVHEVQKTRSHNNARMITMGAEIVGDTLAKNIAKEFVNGHYDGGRHQIRVDMLNKMC